MPAFLLFNRETLIGLSWRCFCSDSPNHSILSPDPQLLLLFHLFSDPHRLFSLQFMLILRSRAPHLSSLFTDFLGFGSLLRSGSVSSSISALCEDLVGFQCNRITKSAKTGFFSVDIGTMFKQILNRLPRKSSKFDSADSAGSISGNNIVPSSDGIQHTNSGNSASGRSNSVKRMSSAVFPASVVAGIEPLLSFKDVSNTEKQNLFVSKLNLCCVVLDFNDPNNNALEKDLKRQTLIELVEFVGSGSARLTEPAIDAMSKMAAVNLFRVFPPNYQSNSTGGETEDDEPMFDPAWSHLQVVYDLLLRFITSSSLDAKVAKKYIDHSFILKLLDLFDSEDPRERDCLKTILHRIYGKFMVHRPFIRKAVSNIFYRFAFETERHNGIAELLEIFGSVISGFALPLKEEHKMFLWRALIPLHKTKSVGVYLQQLSFCVAQFIEKEPKLASTVIKGLLKYWPVTSSQKEVMFLGELEEVLEGTNMMEFQKIMVPLFRRIACCLNSSHFQVSERAFFLWNNDHIVSLIVHNRQVILPLIYPALERNTRNHWNQAVLNLTLNTRRMLSDIDNEIVLACQGKFDEEENKLRVAEEKRRVTWERLEIAASFQPVNGNTAVLVSPAAISITC
ncbi:hypothetical protein HHK36_021552 [Tetracentron sinense]|uniref:Serine/threonine protein phosphatase 2A regulatory subunit n=1 Tax=Tetracentron sinense TaxID=13715 RepID=A0A834YV48_TETSI|nr:hypothetical protein HHK36_021552 [Tetracentron sinense]